METKKVNKFGRSFSPGVALDQDLRNLIVDTIIKEGGDRTTCYIPCTLAKVSLQLCVEQDNKIRVVPFLSGNDNRTKKKTRRDVQ